MLFCAAIQTALAVCGVAAAVGVAVGVEVGAAVGVADGDGAGDAVALGVAVACEPDAVAVGVAAGDPLTTGAGDFETDPGGCGERVDEPLPLHPASETPATNAHIK